MSERDPGAPALPSRCRLTYDPPFLGEFSSWKAIVHPSGKVWQEVSSRRPQEQERPGIERVETYKGRLSEQDLERFARLLDWGLALEAVRLEAGLPVVDTGHVTFLGLGRYEDPVWNTSVVTDLAGSAVGRDRLDPEVRRVLSAFKVMWSELASFLPWKPRAANPD